ncbi:hypothetical protein [Bradyrhizobium ivorense]|uniref:hypothetical protein n=1 Tax=Bradyrhizobium ivorense TaxID=2511166 RepID=UPI001115BE77|nr:hypothetical protein [Bradyrhizobium ivorense]
MENDLALTLQIVKANEAQSMKRNQLCFRRRAMIASSAAHALKDLRRLLVEQSPPGRCNGQNCCNRRGKHPQLLPDFVSASALVSDRRPTHKVHARAPDNNANSFQRHRHRVRHDERAASKAPAQDNGP